MPDVLNALVAFVAEHQLCGDLDGGIKERLETPKRQRGLAHTARTPPATFRIARRELARVRLRRSH